VHVICDVGGRNDDGAIAILVALFSVVLFGFGALVIDIGHAQVVRSQSQSTVDAAALAGVRAFAVGNGSVSDAVAAVESYVDANMGTTDLTGCTDDPSPLVPAAPDTCISTSAPGVKPYRVRVKLPTQHVQTTFGGLFGVSSIGIAPAAKAQWGQALPDCGPCNPPLDGKGQPRHQPPPAGLPPALPDPANQSAGVLNNGCPGPGTYEGAANDVTVPAGTCTLKPGLYVFDNASLDVTAGASIASTLSTEVVGDLPIGTGVTLVFYGTGTIKVEGHIGILDPLIPTQRDPLVASLPSLAPPAGQSLAPDEPIPGVAILLDQFDKTITTRRTFTLGDDFNITGSVSAVDGYTTWATSSRDCQALTGTCAANVFPDLTPSWIATTLTAFADNRIPTVGPPADSGPISSASPHAVLVQ